MLEAGQSVRVYINEIHEEYGGYSFGSGKAIWNDRIGKGVLKGWCWESDFSSEFAFAYTLNLNSNSND